MRVIIINNDRLVAHYWHDYCGDGHGIEFLGGTAEDWRVSRMVEFIPGDGPQPLGLSERAIAYLNDNLSQQARRHAAQQLHPPDAKRTRFWVPSATFRQLLCKTFLKIRFAFFVCP